LCDLIMCAGSEVQGSVVRLHQLGIWNLIIYQMTLQKVCTLKSKFPTVPTILINRLNRGVN